MAAMSAENFLGQVRRPVGQQCDAAETFLRSEVDRMSEEFRTVSVSLVLFMDDQILEQNDEAAFGRANGKEQIDHADNRSVAPQDKNAAAARLFKDQAQAAELFVLVRPEIALLGKQTAEHLGQFIQVRLRRRLNHYFFAHRRYRIIGKTRTLATPECRIDS